MHNNRPNNIMHNFPLLCNTRILCIGWLLCKIASFGQTFGNLEYLVGQNTMWDVDLAPLWRGRSKINLSHSFFGQLGTYVSFATPQNIFCTEIILQYCRILCSKWTFGIVRVSSEYSVVRLQNIRLWPNIENYVSVGPYQESLAVNSIM